ncbi:MAG TPA: arsenite methyltransferase [Candidatus Eisenbacteria bacterium]
MSATQDIREIVRQKYGEIADGGSCGCGCRPASANASERKTATGDSGCCGDSGLGALGYTPEQAAAIPEGANLGLGCGNPLGHAEVKPGETVLDLGSGAGIDAFLASRQVGPGGRVIGVDMTPSMLSRARDNAAAGGYANVEFRLGEIESLPVADASVDVIISNCVINLSPDKPRVFAEALRVLKPGGRMVVSDLMLTRPLPDEVRESVAAYVGCVAGAPLRDEYVRMAREAGFRDVTIVEERAYGNAGDLLPEVVRDAKAWDAILSVKVRATKPAAPGR